MKEELEITVPKKKRSKKFINRELSWLSFNARVLQEAADPTVPLIERLRFLGIFSNNQDEFFRVRVATIRRIVSIGKKSGKAVLGIKPKKLLKEIQKVVIQQKDLFETIYTILLEELKKENIFIVNEENLDKRHEEFVKKYFDGVVRPALVPIMISFAPEFPDLKQKSIYLAIKLSNSKDTSAQTHFALIEVPTPEISRFLVLPELGGKQYIILLDDIIRRFLPQIFTTLSFDRFEAYTIKMTRDAELDMDNDISKSFLEKIQKSVRAREKGDLVRFIYDAAMPEDLLQFLLDQMEITSEDNLISAGRYHNFKDFMKFPNVGSQELVYKSFPPLPVYGLDHYKSILTEVRKKDFIIHYPYQSFGYIIDMLREAAIDPLVTEIKMTLYRVADSSAVINLLINAAKNGKRVVVVVEIRARFDEEANIYWSSRMEEAGVQVIFGVAGLKVHSKLCLITMKENKKVTHFANISTGNFNEDTARFYADHSLLTSDKRIAKDVNRVFDFFENNYKSLRSSQLILSPLQTRRKFISFLSTEMRNAAAGEEAYIILKMNSLVDDEMIKKLYEASNAGVKIRLIVRGICSLIPGVAGMSENIEAISIVDRFLEHARVYIFCNGGDEKIFISSADWMTRNMDSRVEVTCPIFDKGIQQEIKDILEIQWNDNVKARFLSEEQDNQYRRTKGNSKVRSQYQTYEYLKKRVFK